MNLRVLSLLVYGFVCHASDVEIYCKILENQLPQYISYPDSNLYNESISSFYSGQERDLAPACIFRPRNAHDVARFVKIVTNNADDCTKRPPFAIRSGGHTIWTGAANIDGTGITVDMRYLNQSVLSHDKTVVSLGPGALWSDVYPRLGQHNLTVMGGRVSGIGVGGLSTGGGIHFLSRRHGWVCDNIYSYEVVLADGSIVTATASSHKDLWLALKGGSNNFGIVTRIDAATWPMAQMWGGIVAFPYTKEVLAAQAKAFSDFMSPKNFDDAADCGITLVFDKGSYGVGDALFYTEPVEYPKTYRGFTDIKPQVANTLRIATPSALVKESPGLLPATSPRAIDIVYSFKNGDSQLYSDMFAIWEQGTRDLAKIAGLQLVLLIQPHPVTNGTNSLGLKPHQQDEVMSVLTASYSNKADDTVVQAGMQKIVDAHVNILKKKGLYLPFQYLNYADKSQDPIGGYGKDVKRRLQKTSLEYDPHEVFQKQVPGGFKLFTE